jgi:D-alanyl-D-alanine carboxypeptidase (penicillin-binding protein 5/6)
MLMRAGAALVAVCAALAVGPALAVAAPRPNLSVTAAALIEQGTGQRLYLENANRELPIASTTKLMTALLTLEHVRHLGQLFTQNDYVLAPADSQIGLAPGERMSVHDLLLATLLPSADDAAEDLAYNVGHGSVARFIGMMNARARALGLTHTHYATPSGLDTSGNYSSALDLVRLARYLELHSRFFARVVGLQSAVLHTGAFVRKVVNRNQLIGRYPWIHGVKTGHTLDAGYVLVGAGTRDGMTLISAVLGTNSEQAEDANTLALLDYGFANFRRVRPLAAGALVAHAAVRGQPKLEEAVIAGSTVSRVIPRASRVAIRIELPSQLTGPLRRGAVVGSAIVLAGHRTIARVPLLLAQAVPAPKPPKRANSFITRPFTLAGLAVLIGVAVGLVILRRGRSRGANATGPEPA